MRFGEKIKSVRQHKGMTQPELAEAVGIEQSYLSKLENGKSIPSEDLFERLLEVLGISINELIEELDPLHLRRDLYQLTSINEAIKQQKAKNHSLRKRLLVWAGLCFVLGLGLAAAGGMKVFSTTYYSYVSPGVVLPGESKEIFDNWTEALDFQQFQETKQAMHQRRNEEYRLSQVYLGPRFYETVEQGGRLFKLRESKTVEHSLTNRFSLIFGVMLLALSLYLLYVERRLS